MEKPLVGFIYKIYDIKKNTRIFLIILLVLFPFFITVHSQNFRSLEFQEKNKTFNDFFKKKNLKILITDSGLGGMSVFSGLADKFEKTGIFEEVKLIFFNALPSAKLKYNNIKTTSEKSLVFNSALINMAELYQPDVILIACNTLSVIYPYTDFSKKTDIPVFGIVDIGIEMFMDKLKNLSDKIILFGTETTISSDFHKNKLIEKGIGQDRIFTCACQDLESEIQMNPQSDMVSDMLEFYIDELANRFKEASGKIYAGLCCSHYGYSKDIFNKILKEKISENIELVDPNDGMIDFFIRKDYFDRYKKCIVIPEVISQVKFSSDEIRSISSLVKAESEKSADALQNYKLKKNLFNVKIK